MLSLALDAGPVRRRNRKGQRGQAIVLLAATSLIVAATLLTTFSIGKAIHERVAVQQAADAAAYSLAVEEARSFNYFAYANRSIVSHYVAIMAIYGHMSYALAWEQYLSQSRDVWCNQITVELFAMLTACSAQNSACFGCMTEVCTCLGMEIATLATGSCENSYNELQNVKNQIQGSYITDLRTVAEKEMGVISAIAKDESVVELSTYNALGNTTGFTDKIAKQFGPKLASEKVPNANLHGVTPASGSSSGGGKTAAGFCDAVAGTVCTGANVFRTQVLASNADRYQPPQSPTLTGDFTRNRDISVSLIQDQLVNTFMLDEVPQHIHYASGTGMSRMVKQGNSGVGDPQSDLHQTNDTNESGYRVAAHDHGSVTGIDMAPMYCGWFEPPIAAGYNDVKAYAYSTPKNNPNGTHSAYAYGDNESQDQTDLGSCTDPNDATTCGILLPQINFRIAPANQKQVLFNQPRTFAVVSETFDKSTWGPFGLKLDKAIQMFDPGTKDTLDNIVNNASIKGRESILGVASGLAYYHRPGMWREPPNFYNPFWRAKLHPFNTKTDELSQVVSEGTYKGGGSGATDFLTQLPQTQ